MGKSVSKGGLDKSNPYTRTKPLRLFLYLKGGLDESSPYKEIKPLQKINQTRGELNVLQLIIVLQGDDLQYLFFKQFRMKVPFP